jgi:6-pyruvoyltetrahydropterin/6-carboxytetrahydropterin synthase
MYEVSIDTSFCAAHHLRGYPGLCEKMHGHNWIVKVSVRAEKLDELGLVVDFHWLKQRTDHILGQIDHSILNDHPAFQNVNPTSENLAVWLYGELAKAFKEKQFKLHAVEVYETEKSSARFSG